MKDDRVYLSHILEAIQQELLGLSLDSQRGPVRVLVIEWIERPTEN